MTIKQEAERRAKWLETTAIDHIKNKQAAKIESLTAERDSLQQLRELYSQGAKI